MMSSVKVNDVMRIYSEALATTDYEKNVSASGIVLVACGTLRTLVACGTLAGHLVFGCTDELGKKKKMWLVITILPKVKFVRS